MIVTTFFGKAKVRYYFDFSFEDKFGTVFFVYFVKSFEVYS